MLIEVLPFRLTHQNLCFLICLRWFTLLSYNIEESSVMAKKLSLTFGVINIPNTKPKVECHSEPVEGPVKKLYGVSTSSA